MRVFTGHRNAIKARVIKKLRTDLGTPDGGRGCPKGTKRDVSRSGIGEKSPVEKNSVGFLCFFTFFISGLYPGLKGD